MLPRWPRRRAGLTGLWFAENAFGRGILPTAAACAVATRHIRIGAGVFNPFSRHPTMMAMEAGALDELSGGRASIGVGAGIGAQVRKIGHDPEKPLPALRDTLSILRALLDGETVDYQGARFSAHGVKLDHKPRAGIQILLAGRGDLTVKLAGRMADGLIVSNMCSTGYSKRAAALADQSRREAGRANTIEIVQYLPCAVDTNRDRAIVAAMRAVGAMVPNYWGLAEKINSARIGLTAETGISTDDFARAAARLRAGDDAITVLDERFVDAFAIAGSPEDCVNAAARFRAAGVTELALTFSSADPAREMAQLGEAATSQIVR